MTQATESVTLTVRGQEFPLDEKQYALTCIRGSYVDSYDNDNYAVHRPCRDYNVDIHSRTEVAFDPEWRELLQDREWVKFDGSRARVIYFSPLRITLVVYDD